MFDGMSRDELAVALRPIMLKDGHEYVLDGPDYETADLALAMRDKDWTGGDGSPGMLGSGSVDKHLCCGTDERVAYRNNQAWPWSTIVALAHADSVPIGPTINANWLSASSACSMTLIGRSTAISAAHCFHNQTNWYSSRMWGASADDQDAIRPIPTGYPQARGEYFVSIPSAYIGSGDEQYDYAVIDFTGYNIPNPGDTAGWQGWGCYSATTMETAGFSYAVGYPSDAGSAWPQMRGMSFQSTDRVNDVTSYTIKHTVDTNGGQSGQGFVQIIGSDYRVTGLHKGHWGTSTTYLKDVRFHSAVCSAITSWSSEF